MARLDPELHSLLHQYRQRSQPQASPSDVPPAESPVDREPRLVQISVQFTGPPEVLEAAGMEIANIVGPVAYGQATIAALAQLADLDVVQSISKLRRENLLLNASIPDIRANQVWTRSGDVFTNAGKDVIVGIIDTGIEYRSYNFRHPDGSSRILSLWDQTLAKKPNESTPRSPITIPLGADPTHPTRPLNLNYGVEYSGEEITKYLADSNASPKIRHEDEHGHGSHVAGIAAGSGVQRGRCHGTYTYIGVAPAADLIVVRMFGLTDSDKDKPAPPGAGNTSIDAIIYILNEAKKRNKPVVINLSLGSYSDELKGESDDSRSIDALLQANSVGVAIVFGAGNDGNAGFHAQATVPGVVAATVAVKFEVGADDTTTRNLKVNYNGANLSVRLSSDDGTTAWVSGTDPTKTFTDSANGSGDVEITNVTNEIFIILRPKAGGGKNVKGEWTLELKNATATPTLFDAFCLYGSSHDAKSVKFKDHVTVRGTITRNAATREVISVGAYAVSGGELANFSGRGVALDANQKPELAAPGVSIVSTDTGDYRGCCNWLCCRCCFYTNKDGTSMAAPHVTGAVALLLQKNKTRTHTQIKEHLMKKARAVTTANVDEKLGWGSGKLDVKAAYDDVPVPAPPTPTPAPAPAPVPMVALPPSPTDLLQRRVVTNPHWPILETLLDRHTREVNTLINTNKRVATVWHRSGGPAWVRVAMQLVDMPTMPIPDAAAGHPLHEGIARMQAIIERYGSPALLRDLAQISPLLAMLESGRSLLQLLGLFEETLDSALVDPVAVTR